MGLTKGNGVTSDVDAYHGQSEPRSSEETASSCCWSPEAIQNGVEKIPLVPVCLSEFPLHRGSRANAEKEDQSLAGKYRGSLTPAGISGTLGVTSEVRLLERLISESQGVNSAIGTHVD